MARLTWLHLSDWHQKGKDFDREVVRDALIKDVYNRAKTISPNLAQLDFIVFSGDVTFSGQQAEYQASEKYLFDQLLHTTALSAERLFIVPGNHDLNRQSVLELPPSLQQFLNEADCKYWLTHDKRRQLLLDPFEAFSAFVHDYTGQDSPEYASLRMWNIGGKSVALLGLNSAWMCGRNKDAKGDVNDRGFTLLGEPQIYEPLNQISRADVRLVVLHHPFEWLADYDRWPVENRLGNVAHFILCGHAHIPQINITRGTSGDWVYIPAGASYDRRTATDPRYTNAYNFVSLDLSSGTGIVYLRRWSWRSEWVADTDSYPGGEYRFELPKDLAIRTISSVAHYSAPVQSAGPNPEPRMNLDTELDAFKRIATGEDMDTRLILVTGDGVWENHTY